MDIDKTKQIASNVLQRDNTERQALMLLLDQQRQKRNHVFAIRSRMGEINSFITSVPLSWVAEHVKFAMDLPTWHEKKDEKTGHLVIDEGTADELRQREPDWNRQIPMVQYLALRKNHKFPPILVAVWKDWVEDPGADEWGFGGVATENSITEQSLDSEGVYLDLDCEQSNFYALDGQHRLMAIRGLKELLDNRRLFPKKWDPEKKDFVPDVAKGHITLDDITKRLEEIHGTEGNFQARAFIQSLMNESIGMEIIPAVQKGETKKSALIRLRSVFVHVNKTAKKLTAGQLAQLDEDDGFSIVARRLMVTHPLFKHKRVETTKGRLRDTSEKYTTLETLVDITRHYLEGQEEFASWVNQEKGVTPIRPEEDEISEGVKKMTAYFDALARLDSHKGLLTNPGKSCGDYRQEGVNENILFRPVAQVAFAIAIGKLVTKKKVGLGDIAAKLKKHEKKGDLRLREVTSLWCGVLCDVNDMKMRRQRQERQFCARIIEHLLGSGTSDDREREALETGYQKARQVAPGLWMTLKGEMTKDRTKVKLPAAW